MSLIQRAKTAWNAFMSRAPTAENNYGPGYAYQPTRQRFYPGSEKTTIMSVQNRIAMDVAAVDFRHVKVDENGRFAEELNSELNYCLPQEANIDQIPRDLIQDIVLTAFNDGAAAVVPVYATANPEYTSSYDVCALRVGRIVQWHPRDVRINLYDDRDGQHHEVTLPKSAVGIVVNPLWPIMNGPNSTMSRLIRKLSMLDAVDEQSSSGKLDLIIQLPYVIKSTARKEQAEARRKDIEMQLSGSKYGIAYTDGTEKITQLNRPIENTLQAQVEYLTNMFYSQLGITIEILNGTADEATMTNYYSRTIEPWLCAIVDELTRKFLSKTARTQRQRIMFFRNPFKLVPVSVLPDMADKLTRNEIVSSNEIRQVIGLKPSDDPDADELRNKNLNKSAGEMQQGQQKEPTEQTKKDEVDKSDERLA